ncbi:MAG: HlyC/CorC family transporter [Candidatus Magasanikbacteria bacterium]|nr:HlyC/CorC family transporter [Candidatus Magasanikbacteria bacterium]
MTLQLITLILLLALSAFFSASEVAFVSLTDAKVEAMIKRKFPRAEKIRELKKNPRRLLIMILIGNNIVNIGSASLATVLATSWFESAVIGITTGVMTILVLIFGEIIPKSYATNHAKKIAIFSTPIFTLLQYILYPFIIILESVTNAVAGKHGIDTVSEDEIRALTKQGARQGTIEKQERLMIERLFKFNDITAEDIMTPRVMVTFIEDTLTIDEVTEIIERSTHSRYPVIHDTPDTIVGFVHSRDALLAHHNDKENQPIKQIIRPIVAIPRQMKIDDCMREFQKQKIHVGVVVDEYGGTEGIVTLEDVIEELVGEITDEYDVDKV